MSAHVFSALIKHALLRASCLLAPEGPCEVHSAGGPAYQSVWQICQHLSEGCVFFWPAFIQSLPRVKLIAKTGELVPCFRSGFGGSPVALEGVLWL